jgi:hypothetical protein
MITLSRIACIPLALLFACSASEPKPGEMPDDEETPDVEMPGVAGGVYEIISTYDASAALPPQLAEALEVLGAVSDEPAGVFLDLLEAADLPIVDQVLEDIPREELEAMINEFIAEQTYQGEPVTEEIARWAQDLSGIIAGFDVVSQFEMGNPNQAGSTYATHMLAGVAFDLRGERVEFATPEILNQLTIARDVSCQIGSNEDSSQFIEFGDHGFHLPLGQYAVSALNGVLESTLGYSNTKETLGAFIDCGVLAEEVATRCSSVDWCSGDQVEVQEFCVQALDEVAAEVERQLAAVDYAELRMAGGRAALVAAAKKDATEPLRYDAFSAGTWKANFDLDGFEIPLAASFVGRYVAPLAD